MLCSELYTASITQRHCSSFFMNSSAKASALSSAWIASSHSSVHWFCWRQWRISIITFDTITGGRFASDRSSQMYRIVSTHATFVSAPVSGDWIASPRLSKMLSHRPIGISISAMAEMEDAAALRTAGDASHKHWSNYKSREPHHSHRVFDI